MIVFRILGHLWMLPNTLVGLFCAIGSTFEGRDGDALVFTTAPGGRMTRWMLGGGFFGLVKLTIAGVTVGAVVINRCDVRDAYSATPWWAQHMRHEKRHVWQQMVGGVFQPVAYVIGVGIAAARGLDPYRDCFLEQDARRAAGLE